MAGTLITPTTSVSPVGGGQITMTATTNGSWIDPSLGDSAYQRYKFTATPAVGFTFSRFSCTTIVTELAGSNSTTTHWFEAGVYNAATNSWSFETPTPAMFTDDFLKTPSWGDYGYYGVEMTSMSVIAEFSRSHTYTGLLIRNGAGTGLLRGDTVARPLVDA